MRVRLALISFWALFIVAPMLLFIVWLAWRGSSGLEAFAPVLLFLVLAAISERGYRLWKRLWGIP